MARIKPTEIKEGDPLSSSTINATQSQLRSLEIDQENVRIEGISQSHVPNNAVRSGKTVFRASGASVASQGLGSGFGGHSSEWFVFSGSSNQIAPLASSTLYGSKGEKMIVRASCRVRMNDFGARTYHYQRPPDLCVALRYSTASGTIAFVSPWTTATGTMQKFAIAFSGKIPSTQIPFDDVIAAGATVRDYQAGEGWRNTSIPSDFTGGSVTEPSSPTLDFSVTGAGSRGLPFTHDFSYQTTWVYDPGVDVSDVTFGVWGMASGISVREWPDSSFVTTGNRSGCGVVRYKGFSISDLFLCSTIIKR